MLDITDFESVKEIICCRLINLERNQERLRNMPHRQFLDLAIIYYIPMMRTDFGSNIITGSITITDGLLRMWEVDEEDLYRCAVENTQKLFPVSIMTMEELLLRTIESSDLAEMPVEEIIIPDLPAYVMRCGNEENCGAAAMLDADALMEFAKEHGDFYILPASIFEVILAPTEFFSADTMYFRDMVKEVNHTTLSPDEVLSDNAYYYHAGTGKIEILS